MSPSRLISEVWRNLISRPVLAFTGIALSIFIGFTSASWVIADSARVQQQWETQLLRGALTVRVVDVLGEPLSGQRCDDLNAVPGVQASGALIDEQLVATFGQPSGQIYLQQVTPGYIAVAFPLEPSVQGVSVLSGADVTSNFGLHNGDILPLLDQRSTTPLHLVVERAAVSESRIPGAGNTVMIASSSNSDVNECLVDIHPDYIDSVSLSILGWFDNHQVVVAPILPADVTRADPMSSIKERPTRYAGLGAGVTLLVLASAYWWIRRGELSLYRTLGVQYGQVLLMATAETLLLLAGPYCAGVTIAVIAHQSDFVPATLATLPGDLAQALPVLALAPWVSILLVRLARPLQILREA